VSLELRTLSAAPASVLAAAPTVLECHAPEWVILEETDSTVLERSVPSAQKEALKFLPEPSSAVQKVSVLFVLAAPEPVSVALKEQHCWCFHCWASH
jgi:hypothetical protein